MSILKIPSVVEFHLKDKEEDFLAKELFQISRNQGTRFISDSKIENLEQSNLYLNRQFDRLRSYAKAEQFEKFDYLADRLLKRSMVYRVYALNHVFPNYTSANMTKVMAWLKEVEQLASTNSNDFKYKRLWIDKKPGDYGRPLGVPEPAHRIYGHMLTRIMEAYLCGTNQYTKNQHGGTPGRGTMTYVQELAKRFLKYSRIYEFDLKGYFDHISHKSITDLFQSKVILHYLTGVLKAKPISYDLPPEIADEALKTIEHNKNKFNTSLEPLEFPYFELPEGDYEIFTEAERIRRGLPEPTFSPWPFNMEPYLDSGQIKIKVEFGGDLGPEAGYQISLKDNYKDAMEGTLETAPFMNPLMGYGTKPYEPMDRAIGRDKWKDLDLPEQGVPQGSSFGPVLASVLLGKVMPKDSLIYMDDGIVFMQETDKRTTDQMNERYNRRVSSIMCEVNKEKSRVLETRDLLTKGLKIIGTRWQRVRTIWSDNLLVRSETRKGISRVLIEPNQLNTQKIFAEFLNQGLITPSKRRLLRWYVFKGKLNRIIGSELFDVASRIKILGNILTRAYSPETDLESMKQEIEIGIFKAELKLKSSKGSLGERVINGVKTILLETTEGPVKVKPTLYNIRAICNNVLLRYLKGELPMKALKIQGLRKPLDSKQRAK